MASPYIATVPTATSTSIPAPKQHQKKAQIPVEQNTMHVVERNSSTLYILPQEDVYLLPDSKRLVLCEYFDARDPVNSCRFGAECRWVHADTQRAVRKHIHVNWAWRSLGECKYPMLPTGINLSIREPPSTNSDIVDCVDSAYILRTRCVFDDPKRPAAHCAHFYYGRECHLGALCDFAHVIYIDPNAWFGERAPPPCSFGRGRDANVKLAPQLVYDSNPRVNNMYHSPAGATQHSESRQFHSIENQNSMSHDLYGGLTQAQAQAQTWQEQVQQYSPSGEEDVPRAISPCSLKDDEEHLSGAKSGEPDGDPLQCPTSVNNESISQPPATPGTPVVVAAGKGRWRYNPYGGPPTCENTPDTAALTPACHAFSFPEFTLSSAQPASTWSMGQVPSAVGQVLAGALSPATVDIIPMRSFATSTFKFDGISAEHQLLPSWAQ